MMAMDQHPFDLWPVAR